MRLKKDRMMNRFNGLLDDGRTRVRDFADEMEDKIREEAAHVQRRAKVGLRQGRRQIIAAEETVVKTVQENPVAFALAGLSLLGLMISILMFERRARA